VTAIRELQFRPLAVTLPAAIEHPGDAYLITGEAGDRAAKIYGGTVAT
jgi:hypothetical protein